MNKKFQDTLQYKMERRIKNLNGQAVLFKDVSYLSGKTQVSRVLHKLVKEEKLIKIGYGIFVKPLFYSERLKKPVIDFVSASKEALNKLDVKWELGKFAQDYNAGRSTQVPVKTSIKLNSRFARHLSYGNMKLYYE